MDIQVLILSIVFGVAGTNMFLMMSFIAWELSRPWRKRNG